MTLLRAGSATDVGLVRANNQDQMLVAPPIFAVADGMGGHAAGEVASQIAVDALRTAFEVAVPTPEGVLDAAQAANRSVWNAAQADDDLRGMGTTLTAIALVGDGGAEQLAVVNVGDSRTYHLRAGHLHQVTVDHSYVAELVADGQIDEAEAELHPQRHVLTRALGISPDVDIDLLVRTPVPGDRYLLCSDGLSREVTDAQVASTLRRLADPGDAARELVAAAKTHGGSDNITVVVVDVVAEDRPATDDTTVVAAVAAPTALPDLPSPTEAAGNRSGTGPDTDGSGPVTAAMPPPGPSGTAPAEPGATAVAPGPTGPTGTPGRVEPEVPPDLTAGSGRGPADGTASGSPTDGTPSGDSPADGGRPLEPSSRRGRRAGRPPTEPRARLVTVRVVAFVVLLLAIVGAAVFGTEYYARSTYYVGLRDGRVTIFQGRPGGVLWWKPTVSERTTLATSSVLPYHLAALRSGVQEASLTSARVYVAGLAGAGGTTVTPTTTVPPTTVAPTTGPSTTASSTTVPA